MSKEFIKTKRSVLGSGVHYLTSGYGERTVSEKNCFHYGCDFVSGSDSTSKTDFIVAFEHGIVTHAVNNVTGNTPSEGNSVYIRHGNGYYTYYFHLKAGSVVVSEGDAVRRGDVIGYMGNTGNSYGAHLHFGIKHNGSWCDPLPFLMTDTALDASISQASPALRALKRGCCGADVAMLQRMLNYYADINPNELCRIDIDGSFGAKTQRALTAYQKLYKLTASGICDAAAWECLIRA